MLRPVDLIRKKRDGAELSADEIEFFVNGVTRDEIADYQVSALLMARGCSNQVPTSTARAAALCCRSF